MKAEVILEVVNELVGYTRPCGDTALDKTVLKNQEKLIELAYYSINALIGNASYRNRVEHSVSEIGNKAYAELIELYDMIKEAIET